MKKKRELTEKQKANLASGRAKLEANRAAKKIKIAQQSVEAAPPPVEPVIAAEKTIETVLPSTLPAVDMGKRVERKGGRLWWLTILGLAGVVVDFIIATMWLQNKTNGFLAFTFVFLGGISILFIYMGLRKRDEGIFIKSGEKPKKANCMNIYYGFDHIKQKYYCNIIRFENWQEKDIIAKHPQQCLDDGKFYYVHQFNPVTKKYEPFQLTDTQYFSPLEFVNPLRMPASRKYLKPKATLGEKVRPLILLGAGALIVFAFIVTAPTPGG